MKIAGMTFEPKFTLGQVITAVVFVVGVAIAYGKATNRVDEVAKDVDQLKTDVVPRSEVEARLKSIDETMKDLKLSMHTIEGAVLTYVAQSGHPAPSRKSDGDSTHR